MNKCPHCNSVAGYYYKVKTEAIMAGEWGTEAHFSKINDYPWVLPKTARCVECDKKINRVKAGIERDE